MLYEVITIVVHGLRQRHETTRVDVESGKLNCTLSGHRQGVVSLAVSPINPDIWASASWDNTVWYTYTNNTGTEQSISVDTKGTTDYDRNNFV